MLDYINYSFWYIGFVRGRECGCGWELGSRLGLGEDDCGGKRRGNVLGVGFLGFDCFFGGCICDGWWVCYWVGFLNIILVVFFIFASRSILSIYIMIKELKITSIDPTIHI
jgi:hypothetical protein